MGDVQPIAPAPDEDWYGTIISTQSDGVELKKSCREIFNLAFELFTSGSYTDAFPGFVELSEQGSSNSQYYLGMMYFSGKGALQDFCQAHMWFNIASSQGHKKAGSYLEKLTQKMTAAQLEVAQKMAHENLHKISNKRSGPIE